MIPDPIIIDFRAMETYEAGALLLMLMAYPEKEISDQQRDEAYASLCHWALRLRGENDSEWFKKPQPIKPIYAMRDTDEVTKALRTFQRRMRDRAVAGRMAMAFLKEAVTGDMPELPKGVRRLSLNDISEMVLEDSGQADPENVESRIWSKSLPVIHLCAAVQLIMHMQAQNGKHIDFTHVLSDPPVIVSIILTAQDIEPLLAASKLAIKTETLIRLRVPIDYQG